MKIAVTSTGPSLEAELDPRFGRCQCFLLFETDDGTFETLENESGELAGGAGIQAGQLMAKKAVRALLTGNCGPNAHQTLSAAGIEVFVGCRGRVSDVIEQYRADELTAATAPNVGSHAGMGGGRR